jgi:hypothetical protein
MVAEPPAARTLRTQLAFAPSIDTAYQVSLMSARTTGKARDRPLDLPVTINSTSRVRARRPEPKRADQNRLSILATAFGRSPR